MFFSEKLKKTGWLLIVKGKSLAVLALHQAGMTQYWERYNIYFQNFNLKVNRLNYKTFFPYVFYYDVARLAHVVGLETYIGSVFRKGFLM